MLLFRGNFGVVGFQAGDRYVLTDENGEATTVQVVADANGLVDNGDGTVNVLPDGAQEVTAMYKDYIQEAVYATNRRRALGALQEEETPAEEETAVSDATATPEQPVGGYRLNDELTLRDDAGNAVRGSVVSERNGDGLYEVETDVPLNGRRVNAFTAEELDALRYDDGVAPEETATAPEEAVAAPEGTAAVPEEAVAAPEGTATAGVDSSSALSRVPRDERGEPVYEQADVDTAWDALVEEAQGDAEMARVVAESMVSDKEAALKRAEKVTLRGGGTVREKLAAERERRDAVERARMELDHWKRIAQREDVRRQSAAAERAAAASEAARLKREQEAAARAAAEEEERQRQEALSGVPDMSEDTPQAARARGYRRVSGDKVDRQEAVPVKRGKAVRVKFDDGNIPEGHVVLMDASSLQPSHMDGRRNPLHFIDEAQPKERNDAASVLSARRIASGIRPEEITTSVTAYTGAPTVNARGEVIQGNNRSAALREMWSSHPEQAAAYKRYLEEHASDFGLTSEDVRSMERPVLVNMLDVDDAAAIGLGQYVAQDTESGGVERIKPRHAVQKMGGEMRSFAGRLLASQDEDASFSSLVDANGKGVLDWMSRRGYVTPTQYRSAFDSKGGLTAEAKNDLKGILYQGIFTGGNTRLEEMFGELPAKAQRAILATAFRDYDSPASERMVDSIQDSIVAYHALSQYADFMSSRNWAEARRAVESWKRQYALDDVTGESYLPAERFSNFALHLATMYKGESQGFIQGTFNELFDIVQGTREETLFEKPDNTPRTLVEAIKEVLNIDYNGGKRSDVLVSDSTASQERNQGSQGSSSSGGRAAVVDESADGGVVVERDGGEDRNGGGITSAEGQADLQPEEEVSANLSEDTNEYGRPFVLAKDGSMTFGTMDAESGLTEAPIRLSLGENRKDAEGMNHGYGLLHIEAGHGDEIRNAGYASVEGFVEEVARNYTDIREGAMIGNNQTYLLEVSDEHNNTLFVQLSKDGTYWNVNSAGIFKKKYSRRKPKVYSVPAVGESTATGTSEVNSGRSEGATAPAGNSSQTSADKGSETAPAAQTEREKSSEKFVSPARFDEDQKVEKNPTEGQKAEGQRPRNASPGALVKAYESGDAASIAATEGAVRDFIEGQEDYKAVAATYSQFKDSMRGEGDKGSARYRMLDFIQQSCRAALKKAGFPSAMLMGVKKRSELAASTQDARVLDVMSADPSFDVRSAVVHNSNTPTSALEHLREVESYDTLKRDIDEVLRGRGQDESGVKPSESDSTGEPVRGETGNGKSSEKASDEERKKVKEALHDFAPRADISGLTDDQIRDIARKYRAYEEAEDAYESTVIKLRGEASGWLAENYPGSEVFTAGNEALREQARSDPRYKKLIDRHRSEKSPLRQAAKSAFEEFSDAVKRHTGKKAHNVFYREGDAMDDMDAANGTFNDELQRFIDGKMDKNGMFHLGRPQGVMRSFLPDLPIVMRPRIVNKASLTKHNVDTGALKDLPGMISHPIFVFKRRDNALGVLTEIKDRDNLNVCVAIELNKTIQDGGEFLEVNDVRSIHGRNAANLILPIIHNNSLVYADKEKGLAWLSSASYNYQQEIDRQDLDTAAKIVEGFENPVLEGEKNSREADIRFRYTERNGISMSERASEALDEGKTDVGLDPGLAWFIGDSGMGGFTGEWHHVGKTFKRHYFVRLNEGVTLSAARAAYKASLKEKSSGEIARIMEQYPEAKSREQVIEEGGRVFPDANPTHKDVGYTPGTGQHWYVPVADAAAVEREGEGRVGDAALSLEHDPVSKMMGRSRWSASRQRAFAARERVRMEARARELAEKLNLDNVEIVTDVSELEGRQRRAKGFYSRRSGRITIVIPNHRSIQDVEQTLLHEAVAHYGLRQLFGERFDRFLDQVFEHADEDVRRRIVELSRGRGWDLRVATEEYLASLAENTDFERASGSGWFHKIKELFLEMLRSIGLDGFTGVTLTDNELRYILWRSYENLREPGRYRGMLDEAADVAKQYELKVGEYSGSAPATEAQVAESGELHDVNERFNEALSCLTEENADGTVLSLGRPSGLLRAAGVEDRPMKLYGNKVLKKMRKHGFTLDELRDLPEAVADPIAVFDNYRKAGNRSVLTELQIADKHILVSITVGKDGVDADFNVVSSVFGKGKTNIVDWLNKGYATYINKEKALQYLHFSKSSILEASDSERLSSAAKIVENFENPVVDVEKNSVSEEDSLYREGDMPEYEQALARENYERRLGKGLYQAREALQDSMLSLKVGMEEIYKAEGGKKFRIEEVPGFENAYLGENRLSSQNQAEAGEFDRLLFKPLLKEVARLSKNAAEREMLMDYMMAKHGLERQAVMSERAVAEFIRKSDLGKERPQAPSVDAKDHAAASADYEDALSSWERRVEEELGGEIAELRGRDYAGLTALTEQPVLADATDEARRMVEAYESSHDTTKLWKRVNAVTGATLRKLYEGGLMSKETYEQVGGMYRHYIPLRGFDEKTGEEVYAYVNGGHSSFTAPLKRAKGRRSKADDPLAYMASMAESAIMQSNRNVLVKQRFLNFVQNHPSDLVSVGDLWLEHDEVRDEWHPVFADDIEADDSADEVSRKLEAFEAKMEALKSAHPERYRHGKETTGVPYRVVNSLDAHQHQVIVKRGGRDVVLTVNGNPRLAQALNGLTNPDHDAMGHLGPIMDLCTRLNRHLSAFYTTRNPDFVVSNFVRDMLYTNTMVWVKESPKYAVRFHENVARFNPFVMGYLYSRMRGGKLDMDNETERLFHQFIMNGGETGYTQLRDIEKHKTDIRRELKKSNGRIPVRKAWDGLGLCFDEVNRSVENCARFAAFVTSRGMGRSLERSIYDAKEVSVNFNKKGSGSKFLRKTGQTPLGNAAAFVSGAGQAWFVFWNAAIQGSTNFGRQVVRHPAKMLPAMASMFVLGAAVAAAAVWGLSGDDDGTKPGSYWNLPGYVRRSNIVFRLPWMKEDWVTLPLPVEYRALYGLGELMVSVMSGRERMKDGELAGEIASQLSQLLPIDMIENGRVSGKALLPSVFRPVVDVWTNESWTGLPIYKDTPFNKDDPEWKKTYKSANPYLVALSKSLNELTGGDAHTKGWADVVNPASVEYLLTQYFGGTANTINRLAKMGETLLGEREYNPRDFLVMNRLVKSGDERTEERAVRNAYFTLSEEHAKVKRRLNSYVRDTKNGVFDYAEKIDALTKMPEYRRYEVFEKYRREIDRLYRRRKLLGELGDEAGVEEMDSLLFSLESRLVDEVNALEDKE